jgi:hypothetical protein
MKKLIVCALLLAAAPFALANGIEGKVVDSKGRPKAGVKVTAAGCYAVTNADGDYRLELPKAANGSRVNVYVVGCFAVKCLVPPGDKGCYSTVNVTLIQG